MSDNQRYYDLFCKGSFQKLVFAWERDGIDAVVAAVREEFRRDADREQQRAEAAEKRAEQRGRQAAARDIRATGWSAREAFARVAEGKGEND